MTVQHQSTVQYLYTRYLVSSIDIESRIQVGTHLVHVSTWVRDTNFGFAVDMSSDAAADRGELASRIHSYSQFEYDHIQLYHSPE